MTQAPLLNWSPNQRKMTNYFGYLKYILDHKWRVGVECFKAGLYIHAFTHDLSKFLPSEFIPYARYFFGGKASKAEFKQAVKLHYSRNKHHLEYWRNEDGTPNQIPKRYILQMVCDWRAMSNKFKNNTPRQFYEQNKNNMVIHDQSRKDLEEII